MNVEWIPVTERLPELKISSVTHDWEYVLCATTFGDVKAVQYGETIGNREPHFINGPWILDSYITHWMPFPDLPGSN